MMSPSRFWSRYELFFLGRKSTNGTRCWDDAAEYGYYASIEGPWLVCSKSKKQHDTICSQRKQLRSLRMPI
jgi:hypothetical protein